MDLRFPRLIMILFLQSMAILRAIVADTPVCFAAKLTPAEMGTAYDVRQAIDANDAYNGLMHPHLQSMTFRATGEVGQADTTDVSGKNVCEGLPLLLTERKTNDGKHFFLRRESIYRGHLLSVSVR